MVLTKLGEVKEIVNINKKLLQNILVKVDSLASGSHEEAMETNDIPEKT